MMNGKVIALKKLKANLGKLKSGLCLLIYELGKEGILSSQEYWNLYFLIELDKPKFSFYNMITFYKIQSYYWKSGAKYPRKLWINKMIKKYQNSNNI
jgi:hypothetical protein